APGSPRAPLDAVPHLPGQRRHQGRGDAGRGDLSRGPREGRSPRRAAGARGRRACASRRRALPRGRRSPGGRATRRDHRPQGHGPGGPEPARPRGVRGPGAHGRRRRRSVTRQRTARTPPSRINQGKILANLRLAARKGDRTALALDQMRTLAHSPRYWERYLMLLSNPLARLIDLLAIKQGDRIAHQKGWKLPRPAPADAARKRATKGKKGVVGSRRTPVSTTDQPSLFDLRADDPRARPRHRSATAPPRVVAPVAGRETTPRWYRREQLADACHV